MNIELGSIGSAMASVASSIGKVGAEAGKGVAAPSMALPTPTPDLGGVFKPASELAFTKPLVSVKPIGEIVFNSLKEVDVVAQAESVLFQSQAKPPASPKPSVRAVEPARFGMLPQIEPMIIPFVAANEQRVSSPLAELAPKTEDIVGVQLAAQSESKQKTEEKMITERVTTKQIDIVEEETEESRLKNVIDEEVLNTRIEEFNGAVDIAGAEIKDGGEDIDGKRIIELVPAETKKNRSGLIKEQGPDGSRVETIEEVASKKFSSVRQAKEQIMVIIAQKVPVKRAKDGIVAGHEAVARVLKYFFVKAKPVEQVVTRVIQKQLSAQNRNVTPLR